MLKPGFPEELMSIQTSIFLYIYDVLTNIMKNVSNDTEKSVSKTDIQLKS